MLLASSVSSLFKWRQFEPEVILVAVGWYLRFSLSYRDVEECSPSGACAPITSPGGAGRFPPVHDGRNAVLIKGQSPLQPNVQLPNACEVVFITETLATMRTKTGKR